MYSVVIPVYKNEGSLPELVPVCAAMNRQLGNQLEVVFVVDGSPDGCFAWLRENLPQAAFASRLLAHARNFGSFAAIRTGLGAARGSYIAVMAADLQEPPSLCLEFFKLLAADKCDLVVGTRNSRADPLLSRLASNTFWWLYRKLVESKVPPGGVDVFACNAPFRDALVKLHESNSSLIGQLYWLGFRRECIPYDRLKRKHGSSAWTFKKKWQYLNNSLFAFSNLPLRWMTWVGVISLAASMLLTFWVLVARLSGKIDVPGYSATVITIAFFAGLNSFGLGLIGDYVWRTFENTKQRPESVVCFDERIQGNNP